MASNLISTLSNYNLLLLVLILQVAIGEIQGSHYRRSISDNQDGDLVMGKFRAPAPERIYTHRVPSDINFGSHTLSASFRVVDRQEMPEKTVHGQTGDNYNTRKDQRTVGAKFQVSDEGLNYPPSKLSADIHGNVAEIVTAPPEALENDFLIPEAANRLFGIRHL